MASLFILRMLMTNLLMATNVCLMRLTIALMDLTMLESESLKA